RSAKRSDGQHAALAGYRESPRRARARDPRQGHEGRRRGQRRLTGRSYAVQSMGAARHRPAGLVLLHLHGAALARGRQQALTVDDFELHHRRVPRAADVGGARDAAALDRHRLHRARRVCGRSNLTSRRALVTATVATILAAPFLFTGLGGAPFDDPGEGMHAEIACELAASGDPLRLTLDGVRYVDKPPMLYVLLAGAFAVGGESEASARAIPALGALGGVAATAWLGARLLGSTWGVLAGVALLSSCGFFAYGRYVRPETIFLATLSVGFAFLL